MIRQDYFALPVVFCLFLVNWSVHLDDKTCFMAVEIHDETGDDLLPAKNASHLTCWRANAPIGFSPLAS